MNSRRNPVDVFAQVVGGIKSEIKQAAGRAAIAGLNSVKEDGRRYAQIAEWYADELDRRLRDIR